MTIIVTAEAEFIGRNFIFRKLKKYPFYRIICMDKLTYVANLSTLAPVMGNPNFRAKPRSTVTTTLQTRVRRRDRLYQLV